MSEKTKRTVSISFDQSQIAQLDEIARNHRKETGENVTRSEVVRQIVDKVLNGGQAASSAITTPSPASPTTPVGGRTAERSDGGAGGIQQRQGG